MKKRQNQIQKQVERTLGCFETAERLQPDPRFASRVRNRIAGQAPTNNASRWPLIGTWPVASALLTLILVANLASMAVLSQHKNTQGGSPTDDLSSLASDYGYAAGETWYYLSSD